MSETWIYHYGVKGMKWGIRKNPDRIGRKHPAKKRASELSDEELQKQINRLNRERQYKDLTASPYAKIGKRLVQGILVAAAMETSKQLVGGHMKTGMLAVERILKDKIKRTN